MNVKHMKAAVFHRPGRIAFTMSRIDLLRLAKNALVAALRGKNSIAIGTGELEVLQDPKGPDIHTAIKIADAVTQHGCKCATCQYVRATR